MGAVYVVEQISTGKKRALKVMAPELASDPATRDRFVLEAKAAANIESDHVVEVVIAGVDEASGAPYLVMELLRGEELADALQRTGPLPLGDVSEVLSQIGHALEQAHANGIVHRDLKPENIFLSVSRRREVPFTAKILDFGIAKLVEDCQKTGTQPLGTPLFMSPEQTDRSGRIAPGTDVWALGLIAFLMLTGKDYWRGAEGGSLPMLLREICVDPLSPPSVRAAELGMAHFLPAGFDEWFGHCVVRELSARYPDAGAAMRAFQALVPPGSVASVLRISQGAGPVGAHTGGVVAASGVSANASGPTVLASGPIMQSTGQASSMATTTGRGGNSKLVWASVPMLLIGGIGAWLVVGGTDKASESTGAGEPTPMVSAEVAPAPSASAVVEAAAGPCAEGMVFHESGKLVMGAKDSSVDASITHKVKLSAFCLDKTEVTVGSYDKCVADGECEKPPKDVQWANVTPDKKKTYSALCNARHSERKDHPVNCVDWNMASSYCAWRETRLPTEAEFEYAARGSQQRDYPWGDTAPDHTRLNACGAECSEWGISVSMPTQTMFEGDDGFAGTAPVGTYPRGASQLGVLDLAGNVWEWTADWYGPYTPTEQTDPKGPPEGEKRVARGGAFNGGDAKWAKPSWRWKVAPTTYNHGIGFRCASSSKP